MPTYEYLCEACEHRFEQFQSITAKPLKQCPACSQRRLRRLIGGGAGLIFKGNGFYQTDYRSESYKRGAEAEKKAAGGDDGKTKSDSKPSSTGSGDGASNTAKTAAS